MERLYDRLKTYSQSDYYGFHMPGHKRSRAMTGAALPYELDITEIEGFDDLHHADGILREAQQRAARVFGAGESHFLVNGSTVGLLAGILGSTRRGEKALIARNCHRSVYHALELGGLTPRYLYPQFEGALGINGEVRAEDVERALAEEPDIRTVVIVSPSYDGVVSDVAGIARIAHAHGAVLLVDEAHGAHFGLHPYFPERANALGADVVVNSLHKTLPSLTQSSLLHINGTRADRERIRKYLDMLQSSSPSYLLMASLDACVDWLEREGAPCFERYALRLQRTRGQLEGLLAFRLLETRHYDRSKLAVSTLGTGWNGKRLYERLLRDYHLQMEMAAGTYVLALSSVADTEEGFVRLRDALSALDEECFRDSPAADAGSAEPPLGELPRQEQVFIPAELDTARFVDQAEVIPLEESAGEVALEYAYLYPPGIPLIVPGERIRPETIRLLERYQAQHFQVQGLSRPGHIRVWSPPKNRPTPQINKILTEP